MKGVGRKIKKLRKEKGYSLEELGKRINFNPSNLSKIERGQRNASIQLVEQLASFFDVHQSYFLDEEIEVPIKLKEKDVKWITFGEKMEKRDLTPEEIEKIVEIIDSIRKNDS